MKEHRNFDQLTLLYKTRRLRLAPVLSIGNSQAVCRLVYGINENLSFIDRNYIFNSINNLFHCIANQFWPDIQVLSTKWSCIHLKQVQNEIETLYSYRLQCLRFLHSPAPRWIRLGAHYRTDMLLSKTNNNNIWFSCLNDLNNKKIFRFIFGISFSEQYNLIVKLILLSIIYSIKKNLLINGALLLSFTLTIYYKRIIWIFFYGVVFNLIESSLMIWLLSIWNYKNKQSKFRVQSSKSGQIVFVFIFDSGGISRF